MKVARLASSMLAVALVVGLAVVAVASAAPEFKPTGATVTGAGGTGTLSAGGETVTCAEDVTTAGIIHTIWLIAKIIAYLRRCTGKTAAGETCPVKSPGAPLENLIASTTLRAVLGLILPKPSSGSDVALVVLPESGSRFATLSGSCIAETAVSGSLAGVVEPVGTSTTKGALTFGVTGGAQNIKEVDLTTGGLIKPKLTAFAETATAVATETGTASSATEVT
ncbi:MAG TPA: hypothetical protein VIH92_14880 [Solirubrobacteraceae bacterium]